jgi:1-aminocyclopropane-1-carboxylate deaminase
MYQTNKSILQEIKLKRIEKLSVRLFVKRDDLIDEFVSGNKWRKLKYNIEHAIQIKKEGILTFGGAFSNHLLATASATEKAGLKSIGIVRGDELNSSSNETLMKCAKLGMELKFISREIYALRSEKAYHESLSFQFPNFHIVPEGGSNYYGMIGCQEIMNETPNNFDHVFVAQGTTTTSTGIAFSLPERSALHVVPVLKGFDSIDEMKNLYLKSGIGEETIQELLSKIIVHSESHFGGYGKYTNELLDFMEEIYVETGIPLDPIYTGKVFFSMINWIEENSISNQSILFVHTGGIQGGKSISKKEDRRFS